MSHLLNKKILLSLLFVFLISLSGFVYWQKNLPLISPLVLIETLVKEAPQQQKIVYGFLPYWNLKYSDQLHIKSLTHLAYFAIDLNADGTIHKKNNKKELEPGWNKFNSPEYQKIVNQSKILGQKQVITVTAMDPELIESIVNNPKNRTQAIESIVNLQKEHNFAHINIDFEYIGDPSASTRNNFSLFLKELSRECKTTVRCLIDVDIFGDTAEKNRLWDLKTIDPYVDYFIVMTYDYYRKSSTQAGPVAPIKGKCLKPEEIKCLDYDINTHIAKISKIIPVEKIILGIPFYGYEWQTASEEFLANTYPKTGSLATYQRIQKIFSDPEIASLTAKWSNQTYSPYLTYYSKDQIFQIHFENGQSISYKTELVKTANLAGIAIWALGYEVPHLDIWKPIDSLNN